MSFGGYTQVGDLDFNWAPDTNPDSIGGSFSGAHTPSLDGFGPGDYSGGYTGQGDTIYWGPFDDTPTTNPGGPTVPVHFGPGIVLKQAAGAFGGGGGDVPPDLEDDDQKFTEPPPEEQGGGLQTELDPTYEDVKVQTGGYVGDDPYVQELDAPGVEMQEILPKRMNAKKIFQKYYKPGETFNAAEAIQKAYGLDAPPGYKDYRNLQNHLEDMLEIAEEDARTMTSGVPSGTTATGTQGDMGRSYLGDIELQDLGKRMSAREIVDAYYDPNDPGGFDVASAIQDAYGLDTKPYGEYKQLQDQIEDIIDYEEDFHGDAWEGESDFAKGLPDLPDETDTAGGGNVELKPLSEPSLDASATTTEVADFVHGEFGSETPAPGGDIELQPLGGDETAGGIKPFVPEETKGAPDFVHRDPFAPETGGMVETRAISKDGLPITLKDVPESAIMSWEKLDMSKASPRLSEALSDASNLSLGAEGVGTSLGGISQFLKNRGVDLIGGVILTPVFNWLDDVSGSPWASRVIQGSMGMYGLLAAGDPFGVIAAPVMWGIQEYMNQRQRLVENEDPEAERGRKFGYVREGDKWYPAIQTSKERDEGWIGSNKTQVSFQYGESIKWKKAKGSTEWIPYFEKGTYRMKNFHVGDNEVDDPTREAGEEYQKRVDPLRDFYYLTEEQTRAYLSGVAGGSAAEGTSRATTFTDEDQASIKKAQEDAFSGFAVKDDVGWSDYWMNASHEEYTAGYGDRGAYVDQLQDIRKSLEFMQDYRYSDPGSMESQDFGTNEFEGSRALRQKVNDQGSLGLAIWDRDSGGFSGDLSGRGMTTGHERTYATNIASLNGRLEGRTAEDLAQSGLSNFEDSDEMRYLTEMYMKQTDMLYKTQRAAGTSMGFNETFADRAVKGYTGSFYTPEEGVYEGSTAPYGAFADRDDTDPLYQDKNQYGLKDNGWALYQDNAWEFGTLDTADQLHEAIAKIEATSDEYGTEHYRSEDQRSYLAQKAYCRYLFSKINQLGGADYMRDLNEGREGKAYSPDMKLRYYSEDDFKAGPQVDRWGFEYDQPTEQIRHPWGLDPMYSELDDGDLPPQSYGTDVNHREDYESWYPEWRKGQDGDALRNLLESGVIGTGKDSPDYIAGRYTDADAYNEAMGLQVDEVPEEPEVEEEETVDESEQHAVVHVDNEPDLFGDTHIDDWGTGGYSDQPMYGVDYPEGWSYDASRGIVTSPDQKHFVYPSDEGLMWDHADALDDAAAANAKAEQDAQDAADAEAAEAQAAAKKTVPDTHPGATHIHDLPVQEHHEMQHYQHSTAPAHIPMHVIAQHISDGATHIPMNVIASQIAQGESATKVI